MLAPVNGSDRQFITADSHTAERGPGSGGGGGSPPDTPLEETNPFLPTPGILSRESGYVFAEPLSAGGKPRASVIRCARGRDRDSGLSQPPTGRGVGRGGVPRPAPGWQPRPCPPQAGERGSATRGDTAVAPGGTGAAGVSLVTGKSSRFGCSPRQGGCSLPTAPCLPAVGGARWQEERRTGHPEAGEDSPSRRVTGAWPGCGVASPLGKRYQAGPAPSGADVGLGWHSADTHSLRFDHFSRGRKLD